MKKSSTNFSDETIAARIPIADMVIDEYQGHINSGLVDKIAKQWDDSAAGAIILNLRDDGKYAVLDGQHRVLAAKKSGVLELSALCFIGKSRQEEARLFVQLNTKHTVQPMDRFRANLVAGCLEEKNICRILSEFGLKPGSEYNSKNTVRAVTSLYALYRNYGPAHLKEVLGIMHAAWSSYGEPSGRTYGETAIRGISAFVSRYPEADISKLIARLKDRSPSVILGMANANKMATRSFKGSSIIAYGATITRLYNNGVRFNSKSYLPTDRWEKNYISPAGKENIRKAPNRGQSPERMAELRKMALKAQREKRAKAMESMPLAAKEIKG